VFRHFRRQLGEHALRVLQMLQDVQKQGKIWRADVWQIAVEINNMRFVDVML